ncbi:hypothetical protein MKW94_009300 [Papaver nudicaule]|uniref:N-acetyltransferase domain-containing protein n=1 Tax=Papaver nudicaule TaxID=74823 RepID=A0AA41V5D6_PAPNU|nr:hypothetical protein [Papaver nudicaule]
MLMSMNVFHQTTTPKLLNFPSVSCHGRGRRSSSSHFLVSSPATTMEFNSKFLSIHSCHGTQHSFGEPVLGSPATMKSISALFALPRDDEEFSSDNEEFLSYNIIFMKFILALFVLPRDDEEFSSHNEEFLSYNELSDNDDLSEDEEPMSQKLEFLVREATIEELWASARLKAEGLYEYQPHDRYVRSCKKNHAEQELSVLLTRWTQSVEPFVCVVAVRKEGENVLKGKLKKIIGTLDFCVKHLLVGETYAEQYGIISKVTVAKCARRQGVGIGMLKFAIEHAKKAGIPKIFLQVHRDNKPALALCEKMGFTVSAAGATPLQEKLNMYTCSLVL